MSQANLKQSRLDELKQEILQSNICPDLAASATQLVFGEGNPDADIVFIGEAPGRQEDEQGKPFVGASGKFLNEMLETIGLERQDIYITNIVKYRPPNNRDPLPAEKKAFMPYLQAQLEVIHPKIVVTLGRHSTNCFLPDLQISKSHGQPKRVRLNSLGHTGYPGHPGRNRGVGGGADEQAITTWVILPLYHPAAALYNGGMRQTLIDDFAAIPAILKKI